MARELNDSDGKTMVEPCVAVAMYPRMHPKQWNSGGGQQTMSFGVRRMRSPICEPLFRMLRWLRQAALGMDVVPDVNWMLTMSCGERSRCGSAWASACSSDMTDE